jgi:hypothetical protein
MYAKVSTSIKICATMYLTVSKSTFGSTTQIVWGVAQFLSSCDPLTCLNFNCKSTCISLSAHLVVSTVPSSAFHDTTLHVFPTRVLLRSFICRSRYATCYLANSGTIEFLVFTHHVLRASVVRPWSSSCEDTVCVSNCLNRSILPTLYDTYIHLCSYVSFPLQLQTHVSKRN